MLIKKERKLILLESRLKGFALTLRKPKSFTASMVKVNVKSRANGHVVSVLRVLGTILSTGKSLGKHWVHKRCSGIKGRLKQDENFVCPPCKYPVHVERTVEEFIIDGHLLEFVPTFCYLSLMVTHLSLYQLSVTSVT